MTFGTNAARSTTLKAIDIAPNGEDLICESTVSSESGTPDSNS
jgi:hypothetical protein